jgi:hypothetical protein
MGGRGRGGCMCMRVGGALPRRLGGDSLCNTLSFFVFGLARLHCVRNSCRLLVRGV